MKTWEMVVCVELMRAAQDARRLLIRQREESARHLHAVMDNASEKGPIEKALEIAIAEMESIIASQHKAKQT